MSHCHRSRCCYSEPACAAGTVEFEVVAVAMQPRFHHKQHLDEVTVGPFIHKITDGREEFSF